MKKNNKINIAAKIFSIIILLTILTTISLAACNEVADTSGDTSSSASTVDSSSISTVGPQVSDDVKPSTDTIPETSTPTTSTTPETESSTAAPETSAPVIEDITPPQYSEEDAFWEYAKAQYPAATEIWLTMKSYGWTDAACAGIMGNIMRECGGDSLKYINPNLYNRTNTHYGLIQWSKRYYPDIQPTATWTPSVEEQLTYLRYTIINQKSLHHNYGFTEGYLLTATSYKEVAKVFCEGYERPNEVGTRRERNAETAWEYFVLRTDYNK